MIWTIYPNHIADLTIYRSSGITNAEIYSASGHLIKTMKISKGKNETNFSTMSAGMYILKIGSVIFKIIKK
ncbi:T9SS type A sorting domain-containing protein [Chryseobacterium suipulveris]|uniref:T9SS type A sorting domain-containing protein n=1 Tax=Chryseobacterium suipulveris TaxID=2929800 RepID=A0ABY4BKZ5_9FLAO|nr:T9SS type A sorting domain-containing protein [Chryseobacterium suipulveris]UOE39858.1 T9SS type A sorting domain-containing protein [Chryseobacterium suipulveris]